MKKNLCLFGLALVLFACGSKSEKEGEGTDIKTDSVEVEVETTDESESMKFDIFPVEHATVIFAWDTTVFYVDPVGGLGAFVEYPNPGFVLVTDIHGDHFDAETVKLVKGSNTKVIVPQAVADKMSKEMQESVIVLGNDETAELDGFKITAIPMYNLREEAMKYHTKGRGNGYVIEHNGNKVYFSGDTEDIPEMRNLKGIDKAFVCMNLPYTMTVAKAAEAVLAFAPKEVYPYHYRGTEGFSDVSKFKELVNAGNAEIEVVQLNWYPNQEVAK
ncbi:MAG: L-ascorbate metabolism protein UlaG (beta-lactamase superfamily) [Flammeovirgaceae bacterium]|jgi:L-ascorbate metabolism protein UlaG (beta-lactamase superfamily)